MAYDPHNPQQPAQPTPFGPAIHVPHVVVAQGPPTSGIATASMVLGILGALGGWCMLGLPCVIAIVLGHVGLAQTSSGARGGRGMAVTGLVLGYIFVVPWALFFFLGGLGAALPTGSTTSPVP